MRLNLRKAVLLPAVAALLLFPACGGEGGLESTGSGVNVVATTTQVGALVRAVAGDHVELTVLLSAGADAHDYEPSPRAVKAVNDARVVLRHGLGLDDWLDGTIEGAGGEAKVVTVTEGIQPLLIDGEPDPHVWHDPERAIVMVENIAAALSSADPAQASTFSENARLYAQTLRDTDARVRELIDSIPPANRKVVTNHDAFAYFFERYGLEFVGAVIPSVNKDAQASAKQLAELQDLIESEGVKAIFAEAEVDPKVARELAEDTGVVIVEGLYADSLGPPGSGAETIDAMLLFNARKISEALK